MTPDEVMARLDPNEVRDMLAGAVERLAEPAEPDSRERLEARVAELQRRSAVTLTEFLLARIAEDEAVARAASPGPWVGGTLGIGNHREQVACWDECRQIQSQSIRGNIDHIARHDPARVLAECEAKRRIVADTVAAERLGHLGAAPAAVAAYRTAARVVATVYADHPDFREEWRP